MKLLILLLLLFTVVLCYSCARVTVTADGTFSSETIDDVQAIQQLAKSVDNYVIQTRRHLHMHPEKSWEELETLNFIRDQVTKMVDESIAVQSGSIQITKYDGETEANIGGIWYDVNFKHLASDSMRLLFRADMDALPIQEETNLEYKSVVPGISHACGHDGHTAILLGTLKAILENNTNVLLFKNNLRLLFQRAEENGEPSGGQRLVAESPELLKGVDRAFSMHLISTSPSGKFHSRAGPLLGCADHFTVTVECAGGHAGMPHYGVNAIRIVHTMLSSLNTIAARYLPTHEPSSIEPTNVFSGTGAPNIMPAKATLVCNSRNLLANKEDRIALMDFIEGELRLIGAQFERHHGPVNITMERSYGYPATVNNAQVYQQTKQLLQAAGYAPEEQNPILGGEDFSYVLEKIPGVYFNLGAQVEKVTERGGHHTPKFNFDESVMWMGTHYFLILASNNH